VIYADDLKNNTAGGEIKNPLDIVTQGIIGGVIIGAAGGAGYAYFKKAKYLECILIGALSGGILLKIFTLTSKK